MKFRLTSPAPAESDIQAGIIDYLRTELGRRVLRVERRNSGVIRRMDGKYGRPAYRLYLPGNDGMTEGIPDVEGILADGRWFGIEVKRPGGKLNDKQQVVAEHATRYGLPYLVARSVEEVMIWFKQF